MVRNIDLPECIIFYGREAYRTEDSGFKSLMTECEETDTAVVLIDDQSSFDSDGQGSENDKFNEPSIVQIFPLQHSPPNPHDILRILESTTIQPRPFGGSAGFGQKLPDPPRNPLAPRTVVFLCSTLEATRAARAVGTRAICFEDNPLADAIVDEIDFWLDDIATPGSFWLNPPTPKDDEGNRVDPEALVDVFLHQQENREENLPLQGETAANGLDGMDDGELQRILGDMAPL